MASKIATALSGSTPVRWRHRRAGANITASRHALGGSPRAVRSSSSGSGGGGGGEGGGATPGVALSSRRSWPFAPGSGGSSGANHHRRITSPNAPPTVRCKDAIFDGAHSAVGEGEQQSGDAGEDDDDDEMHRVETEMMRAMLQQRENNVVASPHHRPEAARGEAEAAADAPPSDLASDDSSSAPKNHSEWPRNKTKTNNGRMPILFVTAEVAPWSKTGGLGDVCGALPAALAARGHSVVVVSPRYEAYDDVQPTGHSSTFQLDRRDETARWSIHSHHGHTPPPPPPQLDTCFKGASHQPIAGRIDRVYDRFKAYVERMNERDWTNDDDLARR